MTAAFSKRPTNTRPIVAPSGLAVSDDANRIDFVHRLRDRFGSIDFGRQIPQERFDRGDGGVISDDPTMRRIGLTTVTARVIGQVHAFHGRTVGIDNDPTAGDLPFAVAAGEVVEIASGYESTSAFVLRMERHKIALDVR